MPGVAQLTQTPLAGSCAVQHVEAAQLKHQGLLVPRSGLWLLGCPQLGTGHVPQGTGIAWALPDYPEMHLDKIAQVCASAAPGTGPESSIHPAHALTSWRADCRPPGHTLRLRGQHSNLDTELLTAKVSRCFWGGCHLSHQLLLLPPAARLP